MVLEGERYDPRYGKTLSYLKDLPKYFVGQNHTNGLIKYILNRVLIRYILFSKLHPKIYYKKPLLIDYYHIVLCKYLILNTKNNLDKLDVKSDEIIYLGYSSFIKADSAVNKCTSCVQEFIQFLYET